MQSELPDAVLVWFSTLRKELNSAAQNGANGACCNFAVFAFNVSEFYDFLFFCAFRLIRGIIDIFSYIVFQIQRCFSFLVHHLMNSTAFLSHT